MLLVVDTNSQVTNGTVILMPWHVFPIYFVYNMHFVVLYAVVKPEHEKLALSDILTAIRYVTFSK